MTHTNFPGKEYFAGRRTVRAFSDEIPSHELLNSILSDAMRAPNTGNMQLYSVIVTRDPERLAALRPAHFNQPASMAPVLLTVCADVRRFERWCEVSGAQPEFRNLQGLVAAIIDASIYAQQIITIAEMHGLGTCWLGTTTYNASEIAAALCLPEGVVPVGCIALGYPEGETAQCERLPLEAVAYEERYPDFSDDRIRDLYRAKDEFPDNRKFVTENGKQTLAQVFTDVRYPASNSNPFSDKFLQYLRSAGFKI